MISQQIIFIVFAQLPLCIKALYTATASPRAQAKSSLHQNLSEVN